MLQTVTRSGTRIWRRTFRPLFVSKLVMLSLSVRSFRFSVRQFLLFRFYLGQCRPLSKTVRFNVLRVAKNKAAAKTFGKF